MSFSTTLGRGQRVVWILILTCLPAVTAPGRAAGQEKPDTRLAVEFHRLTQALL